MKRGVADYEQGFDDRMAGKRMQRPEPGYERGYREAYAQILLRPTVGGTPEAAEKMRSGETDLGPQSYLGPDGYKLGMVGLLGRGT